MEFEEEGIQVLNGRWGPYIRKEKKNFKIPKEVEAEKLTLPEVLDIIKNQPAKRGKSKAKAKK